MKNYFCKSLYKSISFLIFFNLLIPLKSDYLNAEYSFEEMKIDSSTKSQGDSSVIPNNPFEIVEMIRRHNSMNDATNPYDAINDALDSFNNLEVESEI